MHWLHKVHKMNALQGRYVCVHVSFWNYSVDFDEIWYWESTPEISVLVHTNALQLLLYLKLKSNFIFAKKKVFLKGSYLVTFEAV
jgi:hypothetical protein